MRVGVSVGTNREGLGGFSERKGPSIRGSKGKGSHSEVVIEIKVLRGSLGLSMQSDSVLASYLQRRTGIIGSNAPNSSDISGYFKRNNRTPPRSVCSYLRLSLRPCTSSSK